MKLTKAEYDALPEGMKALFVADGDGYKSTFMTAEEVQAEIKGLKDNNAKLVSEKKAEAERRAEALPKTWRRSYSVRMPGSCNATLWTA
ncbi:hypothetical protein EE09_30 [Escherichia phage vB_EcoS-EE09]|nr:hypothetical protein EE09_30 [Escherichia phage vB_EcoS-EE09]